jgi:hypothetical protein
MTKGLKLLIYSILLLLLLPGCSGQKKYEYDSKKRIIKEFAYDQSGKLTGFKKYDYNASNVIIKEDDYEGDVIKHTIDNNDQGLKIKETYFDDNGVLLTYSTFEYNEKGWRIKWTIFDKYNVVQEYDVLKYDDKGNVTVVYTYNSLDELKRIIDQSTTNF